MVEGIKDKRTYREKMLEYMQTSMKSPYELYRHDPMFRTQHDLKHLCTEFLQYKDWDIIHDELADFLNKEIQVDYKGKQYIFIGIPRGHLKSCVVTKGWGIQQVLRNPNVRILIANAIWDNARGFLKTIKEYMAEDGKLARLYGQFEPENKIKRGIKWSQDEITINQRDMPQDAGTITTTGLERTKTSQHYDIIILDDLVVRENVATPEQRQKVKNYFRDCIDLLEPTGLLVVVGTTWHEDDMYSATPVEDDPDSFVGVMHDPDFKKFIRVAEKGTQESVIFKKKFSYEGLMKIKKKKGSYEYSAQYLMNAYPDESMTFRKNWIKYWRWEDETGPSNIVFNTNDPYYIAITVDPSLGKAASDYSGIVTVAVNPERVKFVLEARRFKRRLEQIPDEIVKTVDMLIGRGVMPHVIGLESFGFQQSLLGPIRQALDAANLGVHCELLPSVNNRISQKESRIEGLIPAFSEQEIYVHHTQVDLVDELTKFNPAMRNKHDDIIDALAWNKIYWARIPKRINVKVMKEGSLGWWKEQKIIPASDLFWDFR